MNNIGQLIMIGISGHSLTPAEESFIVQNQIGGVTLFARNIASPNQVRDLCDQLQEASRKIPGSPIMTIAIDQEGGRVARLRSPFTLWPPLKHLGDLDNAQASFLFARSMGYELRAVGINTDWAPCVDIFNNPKNTVIGDRAVSDQAEAVAKHASALIRGYLRSGIAPCAKHFPGHGHTLIDSHDELPVEDLDLKRVQQVELLPFLQSIRAGVPLIMTGHIQFPQIDSQWPVSLSKLFLQDLLRTQMNYDGLIVTDDLGMKAMTKYYSPQQTSVRALQAGADILLYCNDFDLPPKGISAVQAALASGELDAAAIEKSIQRVHRFKQIYLANSQPFDRSDLYQFVGHPKFMEFAERIKEGRMSEDFLNQFDSKPV